MKKLLTVLFIPFLLVSCGGGNLNSKDLLPDASGEYGHVLVLMDQPNWDGKMGDVVRQQLNQTAPGVYLRPEPLLDFHHQLPGGLSHINKLHRNMLKIYVDNDSTYNETAILEKYDYYAKGQIFVVVKDSDPNRLYRFLTTRFTEVTDAIIHYQRDQLMQHYKSRPNKTVKEQAGNNFGIDISLPRESQLKVSKEDFMWVKYERSHRITKNDATNADGGVFWIQMGILFWSEPYSDSAMDPYHIMQTRDTVLKYNVPGEVKGSYMATEYDPCCSPEATVTQYKGNDCVVVQGLWKHAGRLGAAGGGPFLQYSIHHPERNEVITLCGYIFAPRFDKRDYLRELDAMFNTIELN